MAAETKEKQSFFANIRSYLGEVRSELNKVSWPSRDDVVRLTRVVLLVTIVTSLGLGALSIGMTVFLDRLGFEYPLILVVLFVIITVATWWMFNRDETKSY